MGPDRQIERLVTLLQKERVALLLADFPTLEAIATQKSDCLSSLQSLSDDKQALEKLTRLCARNQTLLKAAQLGLHKARQSLVALSNPQVATTYGPDGRRNALPVAPRDLSRKF